MKIKKNLRGFTLVELLTAIFVLLVGILSTLLFYVNAMKATEYAQDLTIATTHTEYMLEEMKTKSTLLEITGSNWVTWAQSEGLDTLPLKTLPSEAFSVKCKYLGTFIDIGEVECQGIDPLEIQVTVSWERQGRPANVSLTTQMTK